MHNKCIEYSPYDHILYKIFEVALDYTMKLNWIVWSSKWLMMDHLNDPHNNILIYSLLMGNKA